MTCKDCVGNEFCETYNKYDEIDLIELGFPNSVEKACLDFKNKADFVEITKEQAECVVEFLEAEFIQGIGSDLDCADLWYVKNIRDVYDKLNEMVGD